MMKDTKGNTLESSRGRSKRQAVSRNWINPGICANVPRFHGAQASPGRCAADFELEFLDRSYERTRGGVRQGMEEISPRGAARQSSRRHYHVRQGAIQDSSRRCP